jgi:protein tyrosine phosphatase (PTP) superfamily phosphohydrolase (DUF442 family)
MVVDPREAESVTRRRTITVLMAAGVLAALGYSQYWVFTGRVATIESGRLYRSAGLSADRLLDVCRRHGIVTVVDFRKESVETRAEAESLERVGIRHVALPTGQVPSSDTVAQFLRLMDGSRGEPVLIHCTHGVGRTGVFSAIYRMEYQGWPRWRAIAEAMLLSGFGSFGPGNSKAAYLSTYRPRGSGQTP